MFSPMQLAFKILPVGTGRFAHQLEQRVKSGANRFRFNLFLCPEMSHLNILSLKYIILLNGLTKNNDEFYPQFSPIPPPTHTHTPKLN